ncbi:oplophorus-luciferin 2-monooxygenase non-catalytic subunit-like [Macrobrachium nipponense]|uniref:oplophorus-luciferin 2-monooxygenase non-catalytic subunit-like n=1 Tax=Macrobrachium nipponense TaxID=159736 RepID=UPI0030C85C05
MDSFALIFCFALIPFVSSLQTASTEWGIDLCPDPLEIDPCICSTEDYDINFDCSGVLTEDQLREIFADSFPGTDARKLTIKDNSFLTVLHDGVFGKTQFIEVHISGTNIHTIEAGAFRGSYDRVVKMVLSDNKLISFPFGEVANFTKLEQLDLTSNLIDNLRKISSDSLEDLFVGANMLTNIPANTFNNTPQLKRFRAGRNTITSIDDQTFSTLHSLQQVDLTANQIKKIGRHTFIFNGTVTSLYLSFNSISSLGENAMMGVTNMMNIESNSLKTFDEGVWRPVLEDGAVVSIKNNPLQCDCDIRWLIVDDQFLSQIMSGATCQDGTLIHEIDPAYFDYCIATTVAQNTEHYDFD